MGVAGGGVDDVEESFAQDAQGLRVVGLGFGEEELLARGDDRGVDVVGECLDGGDDDAGLVGEHVTGSEGGAEGSVLAVQGRGELDLAVGLGLGLAGLVRPPHGGGGGAGLIADGGGVGVGGDAELELGEAGGEAGELDQGGGCLGVGHRPGGLVGELVEAGVDVGSGDRDRVARCGGGGAAAHGSTQAPATDIEVSESGLSTGRAGHGLVTTFPLNGGGFVARCARTSTSVVAQPCRVTPQRGQCAARQRSSSWPQAQAASWTAYAVRADGRTRRSVGPRPEGGAQVPPTPGSNAVTTMAAPFCCFSPEPRVIRVMRCSSPRRQRMGRRWSPSQGDRRRPPVRAPRPRARR